MNAKVNLDHVAIVLVRPLISENVGAVARAMSNMGLKRLILVQPQHLDMARARMLATGPSKDLLKEALLIDSMEEALGGFGYVVGTTARTGANRPTMGTPRSVAQRLIPISQANRVALVFGCEDRGLSNADLRLCHTVATIPTADFSSLNLAQSVMIFCYELFLATREDSQETVPRLAERIELEGMYAHLRSVLLRIGFLNPQNPEHWMNNIRRFLSRFPLRAREVRAIRGICRQMDWYVGHLEGKNSEPPGA